MGEGVFVVLATNFPDEIDPAVLRSGRIDVRFDFEHPDEETRAEMLQFHIGTHLDFGHLVHVAGRLDGWSAADIATLARKAGERARRDARAVSLADLMSALPIKRLYPQEELLRIAVHECGHALVALAVGHASGATISVADSYDPAMPNPSGGMTMYDFHAKHFLTDQKLLNAIATCLGGMAAEAVIFGDRSSGSGGSRGSDVERATSFARSIVGSYGLGDTPIFVDAVGRIKDSLLPPELEVEVMRILKEQYARAIDILTPGRERILELAKDVMLHGSLMIGKSAA